MEKEKLTGIKRYQFDKYEDVIGKGTFGSVYKAKDLNTNEIVAIKEIYFESEKDKSSIINEINLIKKVKSYYSINLIDKFIVGKYYFIVMEYCDDDLNKYVEKNGKLDIKVIQKILIQLNDVLRFMKKNDINHRDIKPQNILMKFINKNDFIIKLTDFGFAKQLNSKRYFTSILGTDLFKAPEVDNKNYDYKADLYSIGYVLYYLYFGEYPQNEIKSNYDNKELKDLIYNLIEKDYKKRLDWNKYINHPFILNYFNDLNLKVKNDDKYELSEIYLPSKKKYVGQLLKGTYNIEGKGILYYENGNKEYEGDFIKGVPEGKGISYDENGKKKYEGFFKQGKPDYEKEKENKNENKNNVFNTLKVQNMTNMFYGCSALTSFELIKFNSQNVESMNSMFYGCSSLTSVDLSKCNLQNIKDMNNMFYGCSSLKAIDVSSDNFNKLKDVVDDEKILIKN